MSVNTVSGSYCDHSVLRVPHYAFSCKVELGIIRQLERIVNSNV